MFFICKRYFICCTGGDREHCEAAANSSNRGMHAKSGVELKLESFLCFEPVDSVVFLAQFVYAKTDWKRNKYSPAQPEFTRATSKNDNKCKPNVIELG